MKLNIRTHLLSTLVLLTTTLPGGAYAQEADVPVELVPATSAPEIMGSLLTGTFDFWIASQRLGMTLWSPSRLTVTRSRGNLQVVFGALTQAEANPSHCARFPCSRFVYNSDYYLSGTQLLFRPENCVREAESRHDREWCVSASVYIPTSPGTGGAVRYWMGHETTSVVGNVEIVTLAVDRNRHGEWEFDAEAGRLPGHGQYLGGPAYSRRGR